MRAFGGAADDEKKVTPLAPRRRSMGRVQEGEKLRKQAEQDRKSSVKIETVKVKAEDKRWAADNGLHGELGAFQGMIARYRGIEEGV